MKNEFKSYIKNFSWLSLSTVINMITGFVLVIAVIRYLGDINYGKYIFAISFTSLFGFLVDFGFGTLVSRDLAKDKSLTNKYISNVLLLKLMFSFIAFIIIFIATIFLSKPREILNYVYLAAILMILDSFGGQIKSVFRAHEKMHLEAISSIFRGIISLIAGFIVIYFKLDIVILLLAFILCSILELILVSIIYFLAKFEFHWKFDFVFCKFLLKEAWPLALSSIFITVYYYIDSVMLSFLKNDQAVGWYSASYKIVVVLISLAGLISAISLPYASRFLKESREKFVSMIRLLSKLIIIVAIPMGVGATIIARKAVLLILGAEFEPSVGIFQILIWSVVILYIYSMIILGIIASGKQKMFLLGTGLAAIFNVVLNLFLIPCFTFYGAAFATVFTELFLLIFMAIVFLKDYYFNIFELFPKVIISSLVMGIVLFFIRDMSIFITIPMGALLFFLFMIMIRGVKREELNYAFAIFRK